MTGHKMENSPRNKHANKNLKIRKMEEVTDW